MLTGFALLAALVALIVIVAGRDGDTRPSASRECRSSDPRLAQVQGLPYSTALRSRPLSPIDRGLGVQAALRTRDDGDMTSAADQISAAGLEYTREDFPWETIEPERGRYCWGQSDRLMAHAAGAGVNVIAVADGAPTWATGDPFAAPTSGRALSAYCDFVRELLARYGSSGTFWQEHPTLERHPLHLVDVWNEPYTARFWHRGFPDPLGYARMFEAVVRAARPVDPQARFLLEADTTAIEPTGGQSVFLRAMLDRVPGVVAAADAVSVHPYASNGWGPSHCSPPGSAERRFEVCRLQDIRALLDQYGVHSPLWVTEIGWSSGSQDGDVTQLVRARYLSEFFAFLRSRLPGQVAGVTWYSYASSLGDPGTESDSFGLVDAHGVPTLAWTALAREAHEDQAAGEERTW